VLRPFLGRRTRFLRSFYQGIGKTAVTLPAAFLAASSVSGLALGMVFYLREVHGATGGQIGAFFAAWYASYIVGCLFVRPLTDSLRPSYLLAASSLGMCLFPLGMRASGSLSLVYVFSGLLGLSTSVFWPPLSGWLSSELEGAELGRVMSRFNLSWSAGTIVGPALAGWLSARAAALPLYVASGLALLTSSLLFGAALALPRVRTDPYRAAHSGQTPAESGRATLLRYSAWVGVFTSYVALGVVLTIFPVSAKEDLGIAKGVIGILMFLRAMFMTLGFGLLGGTTFWHYRGSQMLLSQTAIAGCLLGMIGVTRPLTIAPVLCLLGMLVALSYFNSMFHGIAGSANRAARSALHESLLSFGFIGGSVMGGVLYQRYSMAAAYLASAAIIMAGVVVQGCICIWARRAEGPRR